MTHSKIKSAKEVLRKIKWNFFHIGNPYNLTEYENESNSEALSFCLNILERLDKERIIKEINPHNSDLVHYSKQDVRKLAQAIIKDKIGIENICDTAPYPKCNGADGCQNCEENKED